MYGWLTTGFNRCFNCERLHGQPETDGWYPIAWVTVQSSSYCAIPTPTQGLADFLGNWSASSGIVVGTSTGGLDVLGTSTQVSLYFTSTPLSVAASTTPTGATGSGGGVAISTAGVVSGTASKVAVASTMGSGSQPSSTSSGWILKSRGPVLLSAAALGVACIV